ncbi:zinc-binding alcohol dehydrogenase family protein [bacterium]|nr:zinc-binding alcohol dehydrogenase family protein [bacterium]
MDAFSIVEPARGQIVNISEPKPGPEDVLVEIKYVGLCGTDLNTWRGLSPMVTYPRIPGHEVSGTIIATGAAVPERIREGAKVMVSPYTSCGLCTACRSGRPNCCQFNQTLGVQRDGALTGRIALHYSKVFPSETLSFEELACAEPLSVGYHAANRGRVTERDTVLVLGCGTIGIGALAASARKGATVIGVDIDESKLETAKKFGAQHVIHSKRENVLERVRELTNGDGASVAIEAIGLPVTFRLAVDAVCFAGRVVYIGYTKEEVSYETKQFVAKELDIHGSRNALLVFPTVIQMLERREMPFPELVTRIYPIADATQAFEDWAENPGGFTKILIDVQT